MTYRATRDSTTQSPTERLDEARRIVAMGLPAQMARMNPGEQEFVSQIENDLREKDATVTIKQLWWLRDLRDKYLL